MNTTPALDLIRKVYEPDEVNFTPGAKEFTAWISVECPDLEGDVVVASGVDFRSIFLGDGGAANKGNPCVLAFHDYGAWPIGVCQWIKVKSSPSWRGLYAKTVLDEDPNTDTVWKKIRFGSAKGISIGFRGPDDIRKGEWGPPTADELTRNPHWFGAKRIIRRCVLIEYSVVPIPMCPPALIDAVSKGIHKPVYQITETPVSEATETPEAETPAPEAAPEIPAPDDAPVTKALPAPADDDEDADAEDEGPVRNGHFVRVVKGPYKGVVGKVKSVHRGGPVPDVEDDVMGTKADPAARVCCYKAMGDGHAETAHHVGVKVAHVERTDDLKPPKKKKTLEPAPLPPLSGKTDGQIAAERLREVRKALRPEAVAAMVRAEEDRAMGAV